MMNPPEFSRADPEGCFLVEGRAVFQLRDGKILLPSGRDTGATYDVEEWEHGDSVVPDHEMRLARTPQGLALRIGPARDFYKSSIDTDDGPAMIMSIGDELQPILAQREDRC